jgi:protein-S-isoprenylcysteine O-methyltransferase Ste14
LGVVLIGLGLVLLISSFARFAWQGLGTPAPVAPPKHLVVTGFYRRVRNPMYVGVLAVISGEALFFADARLFWLAAMNWLFFHLYVLAYEEPTLKLLFGAEYEAYRAHVGRWLPRLTPWTPA